MKSHNTAFQTGTRTEVYGPQVVIYHKLCYYWHMRYDYKQLKVKGGRRDKIMFINITASYLIQYIIMSSHLHIIMISFPGYLLNQSSSVYIQYRKIHSFHSG